MTQSFHFNRITLLLLIFLVFSSCKKDKTCEFLDDCGNQVVCEDFPDMYNTIFSETEIQFKAPQFNPNNPNEFIYVFSEINLGVSQLVKYNINTQEKTVLVEGFGIKGQPKWSKTGWIAFNSNYHIYLIQDNGESLTQITTNTYNHNPFWNQTGDELYWTYTPVLGSQYSIIRQIQSNMSIDTVGNIPIFIGGDIFENKILQIISWSAESAPKYGYFKSDQIPLNQQNFHIIGTCTLQGMEGICWHPSGQKFYVAHTNSGKNSGLYSVSMLGITTRLKKNCDTRRHIFISCSADGKKLIAERVDSEVMRYQNGNPTGQILLTSRISLIDTQTLEEIILDLD